MNSELSKNHGDSKRTLTAYHESGHVVAAAAIGLSVCAVRILPDGLDSGEIDLPEDEAAAREAGYEGDEYTWMNKVMRFTKASYVAVGGPIAGRVHEKSYPVNAESLAPRILVDRVFLADCRNDWCEVKRPLELRGCTSVDAYRLIAELCRNVHAMLLARWPTVQIVAGALNHKGHLDRHEIARLVESTVKDA